MITVVKFIYQPVPGIIVKLNHTEYETDGCNTSTVVLLQCHGSLTTGIGTPHTDSFFEAIRY